VQSSLISKIEKAKRYAQEKHRIRIRQLTADFRGEHDDYTLAYAQGVWRCSCPFFSSHSTCSHTMALERLLGDLLGQPARSP